MAQDRSDRMAGETSAPMWISTLETLGRQFEAERARFPDLFHMMTLFTAGAESKIDERPHVETQDGGEGVETDRGVRRVWSTTLRTACRVKRREPAERVEPRGYMCAGSFFGCGDDRDRTSRAVDAFEILAEQVAARLPASVLADLAVEPFLDPRDAGNGAASWLHTLYAIAWRDPRTSNLRSTSRVYYRSDSGTLSSVDVSRLLRPDFGPEDAARLFTQRLRALAGSDVPPRAFSTFLLTDVFLASKLAIDVIVSRAASHRLGAKGEAGSGARSPEVLRAAARQLARLLESPPPPADRSQFLEVKRWLQAVAQQAFELVSPAQWPVDPAVGARPDAGADVTTPAPSFEWAVWWIGRVYAALNLRLPVPRDRESPFAAPLNALDPVGNPVHPTLPEGAPDRRWPYGSYELDHKNPFCDQSEILLTGWGIDGPPGQSTTVRNILRYSTNAAGQILASVDLALMGRAEEWWGSQAPRSTTVASSKPRERRQRKAQEALTAVESETYDVVKRHGGNIAAAARELNRDQSTVRENYKRAKRKVDKMLGSSRGAPTRSSLSTDKRGQELVSDDDPDA